MSTRRPAPETLAQQHPPSTTQPYRYRIGVDLGGTKTEVVALNEHNEVLLRKRQPTPVKDGYDAIIRTVAQLVEGLESQLGEACAVGIGTPGAIIPETGLLKNSNTVCMNGQPVQRDIQKALSRDVKIQNDANCFAVSEAVTGAGQGAHVVFGVILGTGVGGGIVINGEPLTGLHKIAGEWGHNPLQDDGPECYCGRRACVETFLSGPGFMRDYVNHNGQSGLDAAAIVALARSGDACAQSALSRYLARFGRALATVVNILDPDVIVIGGGVSNIDELYTEGREQLEKHVFSESCVTRLERNQHGDSSGVFGAAMLWPARR